MTAAITVKLAPSYWAKILGPRTWANARTIIGTRWMYISSVGNARVLGTGVACRMLHAFCNMYGILML